MWQDALKRCGLPVDGGELFEIWLNGREANGAGEPETATETADGVELTWIEAGLELRAHIDRRGNRRGAAERRHEERRRRARDAHACELTVHAGRKAVFAVYSGGRMVARKPRRLAQLQRGRNGENRCDNKAYLRIGASERLCVELKPGAG